MSVSSISETDKQFASERATRNEQFAIEQAERNEKFASERADRFDQLMKISERLDELHDLKTQVDTVEGIATFVGLPVLFELIKAKRTENQNFIRDYYTYLVFYTCMYVFMCLFN